LCLVERDYASILCWSNAKVFDEFAIMCNMQICNMQLLEYRSVYC
jgi:hypothetical protein